MGIRPPPSAVIADDVGAVTHDLWTDAFASGVDLAHVVEVALWGMPDAAAYALESGAARVAQARRHARRQGTKAHAPPATPPPPPRR